jgi:transposase
LIQGLGPPLGAEATDANLFWFNDEQWAKIVPHLPSNQPGPKRKDDRRVLSGIMHVLKIGCRWQDCPKEYGQAA